ncbi:MAG: L,D-transpeptidase family protein [Verrucomicrobiales bacterium]|nr:L,D-transpeptidase family protein [Verrucomicrobiales bacterium]
MNRRLFSTIALITFLGALPLVFNSCTSLEASASMTKRGGSKGGGRVNHLVLRDSNKRNTRVVIDISKQKAYLLVNGKIGATSPVSTARAGKRTPRGTFSISQKVRSGKISTIYNVEMPYWMRLSGTPFGMHAGYLPGYPASAGCIRMPAGMARLFYDNTSYGTRVNIYSSWSGN